MFSLLRAFRRVLGLGGPLLALACGAPAPERLADELAADPVVLPASAEQERDLGKADGLRLSPLSTARVSARLAAVELRRVFTSAASFQRFFGFASQVDFSRRWVVFYAAGARPSGGYTASLPRVGLSSSGRTLEVTTRLSAPGAGCATTAGETRPMFLASFARPATAPGAVRYFRSDVTAAACVAALCGDALRARLGALVEGLLWTSESDAPFTYFERAGAGATSLEVARFLQLLGRPSDAPVESRSLDEFLAWVTRDDPAMDERERQQALRYRALRAALAEQLQGVTVIRVGHIQVEVYLVGITHCGDVAGLQTLSIET